jgi:hypothetical protein
MKKAVVMTDRYFMRLTHGEEIKIKYGSIKIEELERSPEQN